MSSSPSPTPVSAPYTGPTAAHLLATRTFASSVVENHGSANAILDEKELGFLRAFVEGVGGKDALLRNYDMLDAPGDKPGTKAAAKGSLTGLVIARFGTEESAMSEGDVERLRGWFGGRGEGE